MKKVIQFSKYRYLMFIISIIVMLGATAGTVVRGGYNLGIDFTSGIDNQFRIAKVAFTVNYVGNDYISLNISLSEQQRTIVIEGTPRVGEVKEKETINLKDYQSVAALVTYLNSKPGFTAGAVSSEGKSIPTTVLQGTSFPVNIADGSKVLVVRRNLLPDEEIFATPTAVKEALTTMGDFNLQIVGDKSKQEFILKMKLGRGEQGKEVLDQKNSFLVSALESKFNPNTVDIIRSEFIDPALSAQLVKEAAFSVIVALILILIYITIRFKFVYGVAAILALVHDVTIMVGVIGAMQLEVTSTTLAAVLTIIGYSLNDTIVVFDRIRENVGLMPDSQRADVIDRSITQSLSRTTITSLTTLLAVIAIFIFATGVIKDFAFNLIIGIAVGTYSSIFIASPIVLIWQDKFDKIKHEKEFGAGSYQKVLEKQEMKKLEMVSHSVVKHEVEIHRNQPKKKKKKK